MYCGPMINLEWGQEFKKEDVTFCLEISSLRGLNNWMTCLSIIAQAAYLLLVCGLSDAALDKNAVKVNPVTRRHIAHFQRTLSPCNKIFLITMFNPRHLLLTEHLYLRLRILWRICCAEFPVYSSLKLVKFIAL